MPGARWCGEGTLNPSIQSSIGGTEMGARRFRRLLFGAGLIVGVLPAVMTTLAGASGASPQGVVVGSCFAPVPHSFADVSAGAYYNKAVSWLVESEITGGTSPTTFSPNNVVTRGQMAQFLWRAAGSPEPAGQNSFTDVATGAFYNKAVSWLVESEITGGTSPTTFSPNNVVTRGQMAQFLWRNACGPEPAGPSQIAASGEHTCAVVEGVVFCWGLNSTGQLGNSNYASQQEPTPVAGLTGVTNITAGDGHTCAVTHGIVYCWGNNRYGQLGNTTNSGTNTANPTPTPVTGIGDVTSISAGYNHTCALAEGTVSCWGLNTLGQLGNTTNNGTPTANPTPTTITGLTGVTNITGGGDHTCSVAGGIVSCWGLNTSGQLGNTTNNGTNTANPTPTTVAGLTGVTNIIGGANHTCAVNHGTMSCWGLNTLGQLGNTTNNGTPTANPTPTPVVGLTGVTNISAGFNHTCAADLDGTMSCWGYNYFGQLGNTTNNGILTANPTPTTVTGLTGVTNIAAGYNHSCAVVDTTMACWGLNRFGQLGSTNNGTGTIIPTPTPVAGLG